MLRRVYPAAPALPGVGGQPNERVVRIKPIPVNRAADSVNAASPSRSARCSSASRPEGSNGGNGAPQPEQGGLNGGEQARVRADLHEYLMPVLGQPLHRIGEPSRVAWTLRPVAVVQPDAIHRFPGRRRDELDGGSAWPGVPAGPDVRTAAGISSPARRPMTSVASSRLSAPAT